MNYLEVNARRDLKHTGDQFAFREPLTVGPGRISEFSIDLASAVERIWDITDPTNAMRMDYTDGGAMKSFRTPTDVLREFIAFKNTGYLVPTAVGRVVPQDLHGTELPADLVIICPPEFQGEALRLAERRSSEGLSVVMVSPQQVFNEFSSGQRDATAIKRFMRMLYDRADTEEEIPRYLLLFGDGSYNNMSTSAANQNLIPSYQSYNSWLPSGCFTTDDYFCLLDDNEGEANADVLDIGVGRLPISDVSQAKDIVDKLLSYDQPVLGSGVASSCTSGSDGGASDWRNWVLFASDDMSGDGFEGTIHMNNSNILANKVELRQPCLNISKVYMDAYVQVSTPGGARYPEAAVALQDRVQKGALVVNYVGHGGEVGWAHERLLDNQTILGWTNLERLPLFVTATCEFTRWDDPARTSAGELVLLNPKGGGIGLMTTTRIAYSGANQILALDFYDHAFQTLDDLGRTNRLGDIYRRTKVAVSGSDSNYRNFCLLGDPSARLAMARNEAHITAITDTLGNTIDTLKALATVRISGQLTDTSGTLLSDFNGIVVPTVFDKSTTVNTQANDGGQPYSFNLRKNIIYRGKVTAQNGLFSFTFVVPRDINYQVGAGRISIYAEGMGSNACGYTNDPLVGGADPNALADALGPQIDLFMNDESFVPGGVTDDTPLLLAKLFDGSGINTLGSSIGHDLTATIDANTENALVLNDVYEADLDTYKSGKVRYRLSDLSEGAHTLDLKAWDVFNNSSQKSLDFVVAPSAELALEHVLNYPNPFTTHTEFFFEHNRPCSNLDVQVQVFTVAGRLVKTMSRQLVCNGYRSEPLAWDGLDDSGDKLGRGVYVYRLAIANDKGEAADKVEKLVILR
jgi:Peptidase family C25